MTKQQSIRAARVLSSPYFMVGTKGWEESRLIERKHIQDQASNDKFDNITVSKVEQWDKENMKPIANVEDLVTNAISVHNNDVWYMDLLEAALDEAATVEDAILIANRAYKDNPKPTYNEDNEEEGLDELVQNLGEVDIEYEEDSNPVMNQAIEDALNTTFESDDEE